MHARSLRDGGGVQKGKGGEHEAAMTRQQSMQTCCVCFQPYSTLDVNVALPCGHSSTCVSCWRLYIAAQLDDGKGAALHCTEPGCGTPLPLEEAQKVLSPERCVSCAGRGSVGGLCAVLATSRCMLRCSAVNAALCLRVPFVLCAVVAAASG